MGSTFFANGQHADYGMFSRDATQVAYAPVFSFAIFTRVAPVGSTMLAAQLEGGLDISAYVYALPAKGYYGVVLINAARDQAQTVALSGPWGNTTSLTATVFTLSAGSKKSASLYAATSFAYNVDLRGAFSPSTSVNGQLHWKHDAGASVSHWLCDQ